MNNYNIDNFEKLLKEGSDEFKMYPTKRVWHSIYNNIHPGRRWPSIAMCITLISILLLVGFLNTHNEAKNLILTKEETNSTTYFNAVTTLLNDPISNSAVANSLQFLNLTNNQSLSIFNSNISNSIKADNTFSNNKFNINLSQPDSTISLLRKSYKNGLSKNTIQELVNKVSSNVQVKVTASHITTTSRENLIEQLIVKNSLPIHLKINNADEDFRNNKIIEEEKKLSFENFIVNKFEIVEVENTQASKNIKSHVPSYKAESVNTKKLELKQKEISLMSDDEKAWVENYALYNKPVPKKWLGKLGWQIYITPSIIYRTLKNSLPNEPDINNSIIQKPSVGFEIGGGIISTVLKGVKLKTGLQLNFTRYNAEAYENPHPVASTITIRSEMGQTYQSSRSTPYSNNDGISSIKLHNETFQLSLPMGMDVAILHFENLQWSIGATIQPSYIIGGKSYLISSDKRNYIKESSSLNRWNLNAGFETFISYKTNGFTLQFGPQFRKQLFTTNNKNYFIQEHLTNYGFKFGISKLIK